MPLINLALFVNSFVLKTLMPKTSAFGHCHMYLHPPLTKQSQWLLAAMLEELTEPEQVVYSLVEQLHKSQYFIVGNGAIESDAEQLHIRVPFTAHQLLASP